LRFCFCPYVPFPVCHRMPVFDFYLHRSDTGVAETKGLKQTPGAYIHS
jgi:hypothetical protein